MADGVFRVPMIRRLTEVIEAAKTFGSVAIEYAGACDKYRRENPEDCALQGLAFREEYNPLIRRFNAAQDALLLAARRLYDDANHVFSPPRPFVAEEEEVAHG